MKRLALCTLIACVLIGPLTSMASDQRKVEVRAEPVVPGIIGHLDVIDSFKSRYVAARGIQVWLPPGYDRNSKTRYPVLYMHDGQNLWDPNVTWNKQAWNVDDVMTDMIGKGLIRPAIVVGINNTPEKRFEEYMPNGAVFGNSIQAREDMPVVRKSDIRSDQYLKFIVKELKPYIDKKYRTQPDAANTYMMGSSMGGLISLYALAEYPKVFGGVAAVSTHWPAGDGAMIEYLRARLPKPGKHRLYFDHGTATLDAAYEPYQVGMNTVMQGLGYNPNRDWTTLRFEGVAHTETDWNARLGFPLEFLLATDKRREAILKELHK